jgi:kynurenine/2-aminoadipate aminotransferase
MSSEWIASFLSRVALRRKPSPIRALMPFLSRPGMISLAGGFPNPQTFPLTALSFTLRTGETVQLSAQELAAGLQYGPSVGMPALQTELQTIMRREHDGKNSRGSTWGICVGTGSQDVLDKAFWATLNEDDAMLIDSPCYSGTLSSLNGIGCRRVEVPTDADGLITSELESILQGWNGPERRPRILYTVPSGGNPTGATLSLERRHELLRIARKYDLLVFEDDAYFYLQFERRLPSLWSLDEDARVVRFDSLSKIFSAGLRLGWMTGHTAIVDAVQISMQAAALQASGLTQVIVASTLRNWGQAGWEKHIADTSAFYKARRDFMANLLSKNLTGLCRWSVPKAGMFVWLELVGRDTTLLMPQLVEQNVLMVPGAGFSPTGATSSPHFRLTYSVSTEEQMQTAIERLAKFLRDTQ